MSVRLYVEGGGDSKELKTACRRGFSKFIENAGAAGMMPRIVACGSRGDTYQSFRKAIASGSGNILLLVDAEGPVTVARPWEHLKTSDGWDQPDTVTDTQCHLMVQVMESWFLTDRKALEDHYGQGYRSNALPPRQSIEQIPKHDVLNGLVQATHNTKKGSYKKGTQSFEILEKLDPAKVRRASHWADRFMKALSV